MLLRDVLSHVLKIAPDKTAIIDGDTRYTYREAVERVYRFANALLGLGLKPGDNIAILANNSHRYWESYFVADVAGMPLAPLNTRLSAKEYEFILNDGDVKALILGPEFVPVYNDFKAGTPQIQHVIMTHGETPAGMLDYDTLVAAAEPLDHSVREWDENDMLNLCYTGGTTGLPKGVMLTQRNIVANATNAIMFGFEEDDIWLHAAPMFHLADAWACYSFTMLGGTHVFIPSFTPNGALQAIQDHRVTKTIFVPTMINFIVNFPDVKNYDISSLDLILYGASPMPIDRLLAAVEVFGPILLQAYGMTETAPLLTAWKRSWLNFKGGEADMRRLASCGREISGVELRIVDEETGVDVKPGEVGEIIARGANVMKGYWKRPEETAKALRGGYMHTGDLATYDADHFIYIVDRAKDMIISGGENIYSTEVENALYEHPAVLEAAVIGIPDEKWGEAVLAVVVPRPGTAPTEQEIIDHCKSLIAAYKCPKRVVIQAEPLPKSGPGKILKTEIRKPFWEGETRNVH